MLFLWRFELELDCVGLSQIFLRRMSRVPYPKSKAAGAEGMRSHATRSRRCRQMTNAHECRMSNMVWKTPWTLWRVHSAPIWYSPLGEKNKTLENWAIRHERQQTAPAGVLEQLNLQNVLQHHTPSWTCCGRLNRRKYILICTCRSSLSRKEPKECGESCRSVVNRAQHQKKPSGLCKKSPEMLSVEGDERRV